MRYCQLCGVPRMLTSEHRWGSNGTISLTNDPSHRMVIVDNEALNNVLDSVSERINMPLDSIIAEAKRRSGKHFMDAILSGIKGVVARNLISSKVYQQLSKQVSMLGLGSAEVVAYKRHSYLEGRVENAYNDPAITGDISGAFESVERVNASYDYSNDERGVLSIFLTRGDEVREEYADRFLYRPPPLMQGSNIFELCPACKAPIEIGKLYDFEMDRGLILEQKTGHRVILIGVATLNNLFGELENELGEEIPRMIMTIEKERVCGVIEAKGKELDTGEAGYLRYMKALQLRGMGNGTSVEISNGTVKARVDNPYYEPLVAGFLAGFYEATTGKANVRWTGAESGYTTVTIEAA